MVDIESFLLYDNEFPRALTHCVDRITERIRDMERRHGTKRHSEVEGTRRELEFALETGLGSDITPEMLHAFLDRFQVLLANVSDAVRKTYFG